MFAGLGFYSPGLALTTGGAAGGVRNISKSIRRAALESVGGMSGASAGADNDSADVHGGGNNNNNNSSSSGAATRSSRRRNA
jgi:hypothetical protein